MIEKIISEIMKLPNDVRLDTVRFLLSNGDTEAWPEFLRCYWRLEEVDDPHALESALRCVLAGKHGVGVLRLMARWAAEESTRRGLLPPAKLDEATEKFHKAALTARSVELQENWSSGKAQDDDGLGAIWGTVITAATNIVTSIIPAIGNAVSRVKQRRRELKLRLTPISVQEAARIAKVVAPRYADLPLSSAWTAAQQDIMSIISDTHAGREGYLLDPASGPAAGVRVNEYDRMLRAFIPVHRRARKAYLAQLKQKSETAMKVGVGGALLTTVAAAALL